MLSSIFFILIFPLSFAFSIESIKEEVVVKAEIEEYSEEDNYPSIDDQFSVTSPGNAALLLSIIFPEIFSTLLTIS